MIAAIVELFPDPVTPVTRIMPRSAFPTSASTAGSFNDSNVGTSNGITRMTIMNDERCRRMLTRKRPMPGMPGTVVIAQLVDARAIVLVRNEALRDRLGLIGRQALLGERDELAVDAGTEDVARLDVQVRRPAVHRGLDDFFHSVPGFQVHDV